MRQLTIKRRKCFAGCLAKVKVYIEDHSVCDLVINETPCRKLGDLKNNEEKTFEIGEESAKVYVIADKLSKNYCNDFYQLPAGTDNVFLSGQNHFNPVNGNPFLFDNNNNDEAWKNRKRNSKRGKIIMCIALVVGFFIGLGISGAISSSRATQPKSFSDGGMSIMLTKEFRKQSPLGYTCAYASPDVVVFALKESFSLLPGSNAYTVEKYAGMVAEANGYSKSKVTTGGGLTYFSYEFTNPDNNYTYFYYTFCYKANDAFWMVQFAAKSSDIEEYTEDIFAWAKTVSFD